MSRRPFGRRFRLPSFKRGGSDDYFGEGRRRRFSPLRWLGTPFSWAARSTRGLGGVVANVGKAVRGGWARREFKYLLQGLPAVAAGGAAAVFVAAAAVQGRELEHRYRTAADAAFAEDPEAAGLYYRRLLELDGGAPRTRFRLAMTFERRGDEVRAAELVSGLLGGPDGVGNVDAHRWVAHRILSDPDAAADPARLAEAYRNLLRARRAAPADPGVALHLAQYHVAVGDRAGAVPFLEQAAKTQPALLFDLARLHAELDDPRAELAAAAAAEKHFRQRVRADPGDATARARWAGMLVNLGRFEEAVAVLAKGIEQDPGRFAPLLAAACLVEHDRLRDAGDPRPGRRLALIRQALSIRPNDPEALVRLVEFTDGPAGAAGPGEAAASRELLETMLARGEVPAAVHLALGARAWGGDDADAAVWHLERAYDLDPSLGVVANNLAWVLAHRDEPDLDRALRLIDSVTDRWPTVPTYRDTRGEVLHLLGRDEEALTELERALGGGLDDPRLHRTLAEVLEALGRESLAARHRRLAGERPVKGTEQSGSTEIDEKTAPAASAPSRSSPRDR